jgi:two-component system chemotaxis response regulator CheB
VTTKPSTVVPFPDVDAVVIGASAGGVEALIALLSCLRSGFRPAVLVVLHVPPDRPSGLVSLFGSRCRLPVVEALDKAPLQGGQIVLAPPDYHLLVETPKRIALSVDAPVRYSRPAIDLLFESAALAFGARLLGIVLTGGSDDGADGLVAVRKQGGCAWVQDPARAVAATMPAAALKRAGADEVLTLEQLAERFAHA